MKTLLNYDTETTGIPNWNIPSEDPSQPHIVQLAAILCEEETRKPIQSINLIIKPEGWVIPPEVTAIHGITTEYALAVGVPEAMAVQMLLSMCGQADRVAYNRTFDQRIVRIALKRFGFPEAVIEKWAEKDNHHCAMGLSKLVMGGKQPKLAEAYKFFTGQDLEDAHSAMADTKACMTVFFAALDYQKKAAA